MTYRALLLAAISVIGCDSDYVDPMERQPKIKAYSANPWNEDEPGMRTPPEGTVPRERVVGDPELVRGYVASGNSPTVGAAWQAGDGGVRDATRIPLPVTRELIAVGRERYEITCAACHGLAGDGDSIVARKMALRPPPSLVNERVRAFSPGRIYRAIAEGYGLMPSYAVETTVEERWGVVAYLQALQRSQNARIDDVPPDVRRQLEETK